MNKRSCYDALAPIAGWPPTPAHPLTSLQVMPAKNDFVRAGRYDIARAVERWGGLYEVRGRAGSWCRGGTSRGAAPVPL